MRFVPIALPQKYRWLWMSAAAVLAIVCYVLSYPISYRLLVGSDRYDRGLSKAWAENETGFNCFGPSPELHSGASWEAWGHLRKYYYPPAEWVMDFGPVRTAVLAVAHLLDVDSQLISDMRSRTVFRIIDRKLRGDELDRALVKLEQEARNFEAIQEYWDPVRKPPEKELSYSSDE